MRYERELERSSPHAPTMNHEEIGHPFLAVHRSMGERIHALLKSNEVLHSHISPVEHGDDFIAFPLRSVDFSELLKNEISAITNQPLRLIKRTPYVMEKVDPHERIQEVVEHWLKQLAPNEALADQGAFLDTLPYKWERLGELVLFPSGSFGQNILTETSKEEQHNLWGAIASALNATSVGIQSPIAKDRVRSSQAVLLHGSSHVNFIDHGIHYEFDACKVMFSSGNVTERRRIGSMDMTGETIVDAYAGVGYYSFPMLINAGAEHVHACEMNPPSIDGLLRGAEANGIADKITVYPGDNQNSLPQLKGIADRCHLGLLPSSEAVWGMCLQALKTKGGWLHVHMNVKEEEIGDWKANTIHQFQSLSDTMGLGFSIRGDHLERVKWYAPHVRHVVFDVECRPYES